MFSIGVKKVVAEAKYWEIQMDVFNDLVFVHPFDPLRFAQSINKWVEQLLIKVERNLGL